MRRARPRTTPGTTTTRPTEVEFQELLPKRRMVRHYAPEPVSREAIERIVATVRRAPSAGYSQGQRLLVVMEDEGRAEVIRIATSGWGAAGAGLEPWMESAPVHIFVCTREADYHERYTQPDKLVDGDEIEWPVPFWHVDAGAALMLILLAAIDEGLAAGITGVPREAAAELAAAFGVPDDVTIVTHVTIGVPAPDPGWSSVTSRTTRPRRTDNVHWERWAS
jgi:FMN reductase [NAD(P)H]